ncbi:MMPL family transporter [Conexibacter sp. DBS9H8]|uniref:MMPL family transporter n=1 Tax=Conexibacter sp. DBS9H8 TaxID=2937801 RepID=UPI00200C465C|nr:MMPL family transporter [Conexibacter sp. DBS9H8]
MTASAPSVPSPNEPPHGRIATVYAGLGRFVVRFRWAILVFWVLAVAFTSAVMPNIANEINGNNSAFLKPSEPSIRAANLAAPLTGAGIGTKNTSIQVVASASTPLTPADTATLQRLARALLAVPAVHSVRLGGVARDGEAAELLIRATASQSEISKDKTLIDKITATLAKAGAPPGLSLNVAGQIATVVASQNQSNKQGNQTQLFSILFVVVLLLLVFRSPLAAVITLIPSVFALLISMRVVAAIASAGVLQISAITQILLIVLLIGAGTDYGLFLVFRVRENMRDGLEARAGVARAVVSVGESITGSAGTVILALLTLLFASFGLYHDLGLPLAIGVFVMLLIGLTLQPALLAIFGTKAFWPVIPRPGAQKEGVWGTVAKRLVARPGVTLVVGLIIFGGLALGALGYQAGGFGGSTTAPAGTSAAAGNAALARHFPRSANNPANLVFAFGHNVWNDPATINAAERSLERSGQFTALSGPLDPNGTTLSPAEFVALHHRLGPPQQLPLRVPAGVGVPAPVYDAYRADALFLSADGRILQFEAALRAGAQDSTAAMNATPQIRAAVHRAGATSGATQTGVSGEAAAVYDINSAANSDLALIVPIAIVAIGLLLALVLRSAIAPLYLIVSVGLSFLAALGAATIVFLDFGNYGGITFVLPFLLFIFLLALGEDYNILVMTRIREEARHMPLREAVIKAVSRSGSTVTTAGIILGGTFAVFAIVGGGGGGGKGASSFTPIGFGLALGILMDTFLVRTLLVPSTVMLLGRWNWWPSRLGQPTLAGPATPSPAEPAGPEARLTPAPDSA